MAVCEAIGSGSEKGYVTNSFLYSLIEAGAWAIDLVNVIAANSSNKKSDFFMAYN
jgi:hypothetical protein